MAARQMQNVSFASVGEFLDYLPAEQLQIVETLRELVHDSIPGVKEKLSYNVPFYRKNYSICFIWPGSVGWGGVTREGVRLGFNYGSLLKDEAAYLDKGTRKHVYWKDYYNLAEVEEHLLRSFLYEAAALDEELKMLKRK
jgi:hypothetical protein